METPEARHDIVSPVVSDLEKRLLVKTLKRVTTARVILYVIFVFSFVPGLVILFYLSHGNHTKIIVSSGLIGLSILFLALTLLSYKRPFICLLLSVMLFLVFCIIAYHGFPDITTAFSTLIQFNILFFLVRGALNAYRLEKIKERTG